MSFLPLEIWNEIVKYLRIEDCKHLARTQKIFNCLFDEIFWTELYYKYFKNLYLRPKRQGKMSIEQKISYLKRFDPLESLDTSFSSLPFSVKFQKVYRKIHKISIIISESFYLQKSKYINTQKFWKIFDFPDKRSEVLEDVRNIVVSQLITRNFICVYSNKNDSIQYLARDFYGPISSEIMNDADYNHSPCRNPIFTYLLLRFIR